MTDWRYFALWDPPGSSPEKPYGLARLRPGDDDALAEALTPWGTWRRSATLMSVRSKGEPDATEISRDRAVELATLWYATGRRDDIPDDLRNAPRC